MTDAQPHVAAVDSTDRRGLRVLGLEECLARLAAAPMGRVAFVADGEVVILPVNHLLDGTAIAFRTTWGSKLQAAADAERVAFEVDEVDAPSRTGWSVLAQGRAAVVYDSDVRDRLTEHAEPSWAPSSANDFWVRIEPASITGRELPSTPPTSTEVLAELPAEEEDQ